MAQTNAKATYTGPVTHEGGIAARVSAVEQLRRSVMTAMLWEAGFYESGEEIADRIYRLTKEVPDASQIMIEAKEQAKLRHVPLWMAVALAEIGKLKAADVVRVITRADDLSEILAMYWRNGKRPIAKQLKKGIALAARKFDEYQLAKYDRAKSVRLRDVFRMVRPKPENKEQAELWGRLIQGTLATPDTWEVALSSGKNKAEEFTRLIQAGKLGDLAFLRNLRNMRDAGVSGELILQSMASRRFGKMLPFQFIAAAKHNPWAEPAIEAAMLQSLSAWDKQDYSVAILVDVSGSMSSPISARSELSRLDAAGAVAIMAREVFPKCEVFAFHNGVEEIPARRGFALRDAIGSPRGGTMLWNAVSTVGHIVRRRVMIVLTDEQTFDSGPISLANSDLLVIVNVAHYERGVGYGQGSVHISGWSENVIPFIIEVVNAQ